MGRQYPDPQTVLEHAPHLAVDVDRERARFSNWYEMLHLELKSLGIVPGTSFQAHDLLSDARYHWCDARNFMVDPAGKAFEAGVVSSSGNEDFNRLTLTVRALRFSTFEPAIVNGKPVESAFEIQFRFVNNDAGSGARPELVRWYEQLQKPPASGTTR